MGICSSCDATTTVAATATTTATVKLVLQDGKLQEFSRPVKASHLLQKDPAFFVCNADDMEFDDFVSPVDDDDELQPGQLYFLLPASMLQRPLRAEDMAALAIKASSALVGAGGRKGFVGRLVFPSAAAKASGR